MQFQRTEMTGIQRRLQQVFAFGQIGEDGAGLVLAAAAADRGADDAHQRGRMKRTFDECDIAEHLAEPHGIRIAFGTAALTRQQHDRKIRPWRLLVQPVRQAAQVSGLDRLVGDDRKAGAALDLTHQRGEIAADIGIIAGLADQRGRDRGVAAVRRQNNGTLRGSAGPH